MKTNSLIFCVFCLAALQSCNQTQAPKEKLWTEKERQIILANLDRTSEDLMNEIKTLSQSQWDFRLDSSTWTIGEIVEHLEMQNQLHFREISVTSKGPALPQFRTITKDQDKYFSDYASSPVKSKAKWFLVPLGRFSTKQSGITAFNRARNGLIDFVKTTKTDLRSKFTFRADVAEKDISELKIGEVRDLHQLLLTGIAHTDRHITQIRKIKSSDAFPNHSE